MSYTRVKIFHDGECMDVMFNSANFNAHKASIGLKAFRKPRGQFKIYAVMTFCNPIDKFNRSHAMKVIAHRFASTKRGIVNKMCIDTLPKSTVFNEARFETYAKLVFDRFEEAAEIGSYKYDVAKATGKFPLPSRSDTIRAEFVKRVAKLSYIKVKTIKKELQTA